MKEKLTKVFDEMNKFSFAQMTSNSSGKTSGSGTMGVYIIVISCLAFVYGAFEFHYSGKSDIMMYSSANILVGAGLLGYRKSKEGTGLDLIKPEENKPVDQAPVEEPKS